MKNKNLTFFLLVRLMQGGLILVAFEKLGHCYFDVGVGSLLLQYVIGCIAGVLMFGKMFKKNIQAFWAKLFAKKSKD